MKPLRKFSQANSNSPALLVYSATDPRTWRCRLRPNDWAAPLLLIVLLIVQAGFVVGDEGAAERDEQVRLARFLVLGLELDYSAPARKVESQANSWEPGTQPFPLDVQQAALRAASHLRSVRQVDAPVRLVSVRIESLIAYVSASGKHERRWYVVLGFNSTSVDGKLILAHELSVVMLLDGTIATERLLAGTLQCPQRSDQK